MMTPRKQSNIFLARQYLFTRRTVLINQVMAAYFTCIMYNYDVTTILFIIFYLFMLIHLLFSTK